MKLSQIINYPLGLLGLKVIRKSRLELVNLSDIEQDKKFLVLYKKVKDYTLVPVERCFALYQTVQYIIKNNIEGDFVECGVWKGGSSMLMAYTLQDAGIGNRKIYLYDTFEGMTKPGEMDGPEEKDQWEQGRVTDTLNNMCYSPIEEAKANRDPIAIAAELLLEKNVLTDALIVKIHDEAVVAARAAMQFSDDSPIPPAEELLKDVYV